MADESASHDERYRGEGRSSPYGLSRLAPPIELVNVAKEIAEADKMVGTVVGSKLDVIAQQIRRLQEDAREILERAKRDLDLHRARCSFPRRPGQVYHLYDKTDDGSDLYWSMVSPDEWGGQPPHRFVGTYRLEIDQSWTAAEEIRQAPPVDGRDVASRLMPALPSGE
ncbi:MAG: DUF2452 domain-containing protein [Myxococcota bacterium]